MLESAATNKVAAQESSATMHLIGLFSENCSFYVLRMDVGKGKLCFRPYCSVAGPHDSFRQTALRFPMLVESFRRYCCLLVWHETIALKWR